MSRKTASSPVKLGFEEVGVRLPIAAIQPLRVVSNAVKKTPKYAQIAASIREVGIVEPPVVARDRADRSKYLLLDGHFRVEVLKDMGTTEVVCLVSTDDEAFTYNKRVNRLAPIQEHRMIARAIDRGVSSSDIADALGLQAQSVIRRFKLLEGISPEAAEMLKDTPCSMKVFDILRQMSAVRQIEAADLMIGQHNFTTMFARAIRAATPDSQLVAPRKTSGAATTTPSGQQIARMERELAALQTQVKSVEETYGIDNLHLTVARGYISKLLANGRIIRWLAHHHQEYLGEFQKIAEIDTIGPLTESSQI